MNTIKSTLLAIAVAAGTIGSAHADTRTDTFEVRIRIVESCTISATDIDFDEVTRGTAATASGTLTVNCSAGTPYDITLNGGANPDGSTITTTSRRMANGSVYVPYGLYSDGARTSVWGNDAASDVSGTGTGGDVDHPVYAAVTAAATNVARNDYVDTVTATITY
ncbi:spore coat protein U domain-containing protein [Luteimonas marina]|uniref:Spore coat protein U domain-containing protein n=1 Tax=Luteimonas marina TaxID=488485 RepID=A0A5C5U1B7_9GAMM|nr:spore coat U domain-containing protein [Luteimonas marina]TWT20203.1 spore coat protein U domain-containing protein [Luteimonas marina]